MPAHRSPHVSAYVGSITSPALGAHAIVKASNPQVRLGSGVSAAIREACGGPAYQAAILERLEEDFGDALEPAAVREHCASESAIKEVRFAVLTDEIARLFPLAAAKHGVPTAIT